MWKTSMTVVLAVILVLATTGTQPAAGKDVLKPVPVEVRRDPAEKIKKVEKHPGLYMAGKNDRWGFIDKTGKIVIPLKYCGVRDFSEGLAAVAVGKKVGYINTAGRMVIKPIRMFEPGGFREGMAPILVGGLPGMGGLFGYLDRKGKMVIKPKYLLASSFHEGLAWVIVEIGGHWAAIDRQGKEVIKAGQWAPYPFNNGLALGTDGPVSKSFIDKTGKVVLTPQVDRIEEDFSEDLAVVLIGRKYGYIDRKGKVVIKPRFEYADSFSEGLAAVCIDGKYGYIDKKGKIVIKPKFVVAFEFSSGMAMIADKTGKHGYIDKTGKVVIRPRFDGCSNFHGDLATAKIIGRRGRRGKEGYINKRGKFVWVDQVSPLQ